MVERGIRTMEKRLEEHRAWIADPSLKLPPDTDPREIAALVSKKWPADIARIEDEISVLRGLLEERQA
jgi:hypothetical protein